MVPRALVRLPVPAPYARRDATFLFLMTHVANHIIPKLAKRAAGIVLPVLCLLSAGCVHYSTTATRAATFTQYESGRIGEVSLRDYLLARSAVLIQAEDVRLIRPSLDKSCVFITGKRIQHGIAAAIDRRGYFLTAAHCVESGPVWLLFPCSGTSQPFRARIVWRGDDSKGEPDLAILHASVPLQNEFLLLHASVPLQHEFAWATDFAPGTSGVAVGVSADKPHVLSMQCMAGRIVALRDESSPAGTRYSLVSHDVPLRHGDSGGPLADMNGRLLGINVAGYLGIKWKKLSVEPLCWYAHRPDPAWLRRMIDRDVRSSKRN
jgi:Trypsin-like peptidase domain